MDYRTKMEMVRRARMGSDDMEPESRRRRGRNGRFIRSEYEAEMYGQGTPGTYSDDDYGYGGARYNARDAYGYGARNAYDAYDAYDTYDRYEARYDGPDDRMMEARGRRMSYGPRSHHGMQGREQSPRMGKIGFAKEPDKLTWEMAQEWVSNIKSKSGKGQKWEFEQVQKIVEQQKLPYDPVEFWAVLNAVHSDYAEVFRKYGVTTLDAFIDMAKAWLDDEDAVDDKALAYFECIVK